MAGERQIFYCGVGLFATGIAIFGIQGLYFGKLIEGLQPIDPGAGPGIFIAAANGILLTASGVALLWPRFSKVGAISIATIFAASFILLLLPALFTGEIGLTAFVAPLECLAIIAAAIKLFRPQAMPVARLTGGAMLLLFGVIHLAEHAFVASLIPAWLPFQKLWPWVTGSVMLLAGLSMLAGKFDRLATLMVAAMFLAWIPFIHLGRLIAEPASPFEWAFASTAIVLAGALLIVSGDARRQAMRIGDPHPKSTGKRSGGSPNDG